MGCAASSAVDQDAKLQNDKIETQLKRDKQAARVEVKMLLLGAGESGKSTILKQMKLIHTQGYNKIERQAHREIVFSNTIQSMQAVIEALPTLGLVLKPESDPYADHVRVMRTHVESEYLPREINNALQALWSDPAVRAAVERRREFQLNDSATYFFESLERISTPGYVPDDNDILRSRVKSTGITETLFHVGKLRYRLFDVGGQRSERKKWIHCFENVTALVFLVAISEYDQQLYEDGAVNRMQEALNLFDSVSNSRWFTKTSIILFLNKIDLFAEKIGTSPLVDYFPEYDGGANYDKAREFIRNRFLSLHRDKTTKIYSHFTCATDTNQVKVVMAAVQDILMEKFVSEIGLL